MIEGIICWFVQNWFFVLLVILILVGIGGWLLKNMSVDVIFDFLDVQVIIKISYFGQVLQVVEDQVIYLLIIVMLLVLGVVIV